MNASPIAELDLLLGSALSEISAAPNSVAIEQLRVALLGRQGTVTAHLKLIGAQPSELRREFGAAVNRVRDQLTRRRSKKKSTKPRLLPRRLTLRFPGGVGMKVHCILSVGR